MKLFFLRHGIAEDPRPGLGDSGRRLTAGGIEEMRGVGRGLRTLGLAFDAILTSPLPRARETAEIAAAALGLEDRLRVEDRLGCGCRFADLERLLRDQAPRGRVLLVGHEPDMSYLVGALTG